MYEDTLLLQKLDPLAYLHVGPALEFKLADVKAGEVEGYASVFDDDEPDSYNDRVAAGAFARSLAKADSLPMLLFHDPTRPAGVWAQVREDRRGLHVRGRMNLDTQVGAEAYAHVRGGSIKGLSIGYLLFPGGFKHQPDGSRLLTEVDVREVSLTPLPAQRTAGITAVKQAFSTKAELEDILRQSLPGRAVQKLLRGGWPALSGEADEPDPVTDVLAERLARASRQIEGL